MKKKIRICLALIMKINGGGFVVIFIIRATRDNKLMEVNCMIVLPPKSKRQSGRPKEIRVPSAGEVTRIQHCTKYGKPEHNRLGCPNPVAYHPQYSQVHPLVRISQYVDNVLVVFVTYLAITTRHARWLTGPKVLRVQGILEALANMLPGLWRDEGFISTGDCQRRTEVKSEGQGRSATGEVKDRDDRRRATGDDDDDRRLATTTIGDDQ
ncbi:hypothetical protein LWI29_002056 [Acer saccharum]|uniref:Uncharacterized protein n=1 Tax=Acer saccharum TaxID=4024 RepID=A0AA39S7D9_ACESA|nr:hypothetical protein LWI29_002056 [Acer saccharum]